MYAVAFMASQLKRTHVYHYLSMSFWHYFTSSVISDLFSVHQSRWAPFDFDRTVCCCGVGVGGMAWRYRSARCRCWSRSWAAVLGGPNFTGTGRPAKRPAHVRGDFSWQITCTAPAAILSRVQWWTLPFCLLVFCNDTERWSWDLPIMPRTLSLEVSWESHDQYEWPWVPKC